MKKNKKVQNFFDMGSVQDGELIDISSLTDNARNLYKEYCEILGIKGLPIKDKGELENIANSYYLEVFIKRMRTSVENNPEIKNDICRKETILYLREFAFKLKNTNLNKAVRSEIFSDPVKFHQRYSDNEIYNILKEFLDEGKVEITNHLKDIYDIVSGDFSVCDLENAIEACIKNGKTIYNIKYLYSILISLKESEEAQINYWRKQAIEIDFNTKRINEQAEADEIESQNKREFTKKEDEIFNNILSLGRSNDKENK